jgi:hypothetical protein
MGPYMDDRLSVISMTETLMELLTGMRTAGMEVVFFMRSL